MRNEFEVIIVGAGPAGSAAAGVLTAAGRDVCWLERQPFPRTKACAGILPPRTLGTIGLDPLPCSLDELDAVPFHGYRLIDAEGLRIKPFATPGLIVTRSAFDRYLADRLPIVRQAVTARRLEAQPCGVMIDADIGTYHAQYVIVADGARSFVHGRERRRQLHLAVQYRFTVPQQWLCSRDRYVEFQFTLRNGYFWIVPARHSLLIGALAVRRSWRPTAFRELMEFSHEWLSAHGLDPGLVPETEAAMLPMSGPWEMVRHDARVLLVGDAGGFTDPNTGEGIVYAVISGRLAARAVEKALSSGLSGRSAGNIYIESIITSGLTGLRRHTRLTERAQKDG